MRAGDLVEPGENHGCRGLDGRAHGIILEYLPSKKGYREAVVVRWNDGEIELEVPGWLEIINEAR